MNPIRQLRNDRDLTQQQVADRAGISQSHLSAIEKREDLAATSGDVLVRLAGTLGTTVEKLLRPREEMK